MKNRKTPFGVMSVTTISSQELFSLISDKGKEAACKAALEACYLNGAAHKNVWKSFWLPGSSEEND